MKIKISTIKKVIGVLFISLFAFFLVYPNTGLPRSEENAELVVQRENRKITPAPTQSLKDKEFYKQFEKWYQDRLRYKYKLISAWRKTNFLFGIVVDKDMFVGRDGWFFSRKECISDFIEPSKKIDFIKKLQNYCQSHNKDFIMMLPPKNESVYRDYFPNEIKNLYKNPEYYQDNAANLFKSYDINYLSISKELQQQRNIESHDLYFKDDYHWGYYAAATASNLLLKKINLDLGNNFYNGLKLDGSTREAYKPNGHLVYFGFNKSYDTVTEAPWSKEYTDEIYLTDCYTGKTEKAEGVISQIPLWEITCKGEAIVTNKAIKNNIKLLLLCDSYTTYMAPYLSQHVKQIVLTNYDVCTGNKKEVNIPELIKKYNPDAIVLIMLETGFFHRKSDYLFRFIKF